MKKPRKIILSALPVILAGFVLVTAIQLAQTRRFSAGPPAMRSTPLAADVASHTTHQVDDELTMAMIEEKHSPPSAKGIVSTEREFQDPFYAFVIGIAESDSLGVWDQHDLNSFLDRYGLESNLPLEYFHTLERRAVAKPAAESLRGVMVTRTWCLTLQEPLRYAMPYNVLGYHLGSLAVARVLTFSEWQLGNRNIHAPQDNEISVIPVTGLTVFRLDSGWIVMDVNGLLDKLLGRKVDDCWTQGFAICRQGGEIRGLALSCNRDLRPLCGEIDFTTNEISPEGGPFARGVAVTVRPWVAPPAHASGRIWQFEN